MEKLALTCGPSLPCAQLSSNINKTHGKETKDGKERKNTRQRNTHGKEGEKPTAKTHRTANTTQSARLARQRRCRPPTFAVRDLRLHSKGCFAVCFAFAMRHLAFSSFLFYFYFQFHLVLCSFLDVFVR